MNSINFSIGGDNSKFVAVTRQTQAIGLRMANRVNLQFGAMAVGVGTFLGGAALRLAAYFSQVARSAGRGVVAAYDLGGALSDVSAQTGIFAGRAQILMQALRNSGVSGEALQPIINRLQKAMGAASDGNKTARKSFADIGVDWKDLASLSPDKQFLAVGAAISSIDDPTARASAAMAIFGKSGGQLLAFFADKNAVSTAAREIGSAADVMDQKSGVFDTISDKLANMVPAKTSGLFIGLADSLSEPLLALLETIEQSDLLSKGQEIGKWVIDAAQFAVDSFHKVRELLLQAQEGMATMVGLSAEIVNLLWDGLGRFGLLMQATWHAAAFDAKMITAGLSEGVVSMALDLQTALQFAFQHVVRFFDDKMGAVIDSVSAGLEFAIQQAMEGIAKIPILNKQLGLEGFKSESFDQIRGKAADARAGRQSQNLSTYGELRAENYNNSGWMQGAMLIVDGIRKSASESAASSNSALADAASENRNNIVDPQIFYDVANGLRNQREDMASPSQIATGKPTSTPGATAALSTWQRLQNSTSSFQALQSGKIGDRTNATLGASPVLRTESLIGNGAESRRAAKERKEAASAEKDKDKTPEGTNSRLDNLINIVEEAWTK